MTRFFDFLGTPEDFAVGPHCVLEGLNRGLVGYDVIQSRVVTELEIVAGIELGVVRQQNGLVGVSNHLLLNHGLIVVGLVGSIAIKPAAGEKGQVGMEVIDKLGSKVTQGRVGAKIDMATR